MSNYCSLINKTCAMSRIQDEFCSRLIEFHTLIKAFASDGRRIIMMEITILCQAPSPVMMFVSSLYTQIANEIVPSLLISSRWNALWIRSAQQQPLNYAAQPNKNMQSIIRAQFTGSLCAFLQKHDGTHRSNFQSYLHALCRDAKRFLCNP